MISELQDELGLMYLSGTAARPVDTDLLYYGYHNYNEVDLTGLGLHIIPGAVASLGVHTLFMSNNVLSDVSPQVCKMRNLTIMHLSHNKMSTVPKALTHMRGLRYVDMRHNPFICRGTEIAAVIGQMQAPVVTDLPDGVSIENRSVDGTWPACRVLI